VRTARGLKMLGTGFRVPPAIDLSDPALVSFLFFVYREEKRLVSSKVVDLRDLPGVRVL
jgi:hypothetical protein